MLQAESYRREAAILDNLCKALEKAIFAAFRSMGAAYFNKLRTIVSNLKENSELRSNLLTGVITPKKLVLMSTEEMARSEVSKIREEAAKPGLVERIGSILEDGGISNERSGRAAANLKHGGVATAKTLKHHEVTPTVEDRREKESLAQEEKGSGVK